MQVREIKSVSISGSLILFPAFRLHSGPTFILTHHNKRSEISQTSHHSSEREREF